MLELAKPLPRGRKTSRSLCVRPLYLSKMQMGRFPSSFLVAERKLSLRKGALPPKVAAKRVNFSRTCPAHRAWVRKHHCSVPGCLSLPIECAHVRRGTDGGTGLKPSDCWIISLCSNHHMEQHRLGEQTFGKKYGLNLVELAEVFARTSPHRSKIGAPPP